MKKIKLEITPKEEEAEKNVKKRRRKRRIIIGIIIAILVVLISIFVVFNYFYANKRYIRADVKISSSSRLYQNSDPKDIEDVGEGALFILHITGIKRDDFLEEYEVVEITINGEKINLENVTYRHLNNALSIRMHSENYNLEKGNVVTISLKEKSTGYKLKRRLYNKTDIV